MNVTSQDVAVQAGVSRGTVSQILNGHASRFASETVDRVRRAAAELDYQPSIAGRTLARGSSDIIIALIPNTTFGGNLQDLFERVTDELAEHGLMLVLRMATASTAALDRLVSGLRPAAVVSMTRLTDQEREVLAARDVNVLEPSAPTQSDVLDEIGALQARTLIEYGYTRLAFAHLRDAREDPFGESRERAVRAVCRDAGIADPVVLSLGIDRSEAAAALDALGDPGAAVACYNDDVAMALLAAATARRWRVPQQLALIGMDCTPLSQLTEPALTTIAYDYETAVRLMTAGVLAMLGYETFEQSQEAPVLQLVEGGTV